MARGWHRAADCRHPGGLLSSPCLSSWHHARSAVFAPCHLAHARISQLPPLPPGMPLQALMCTRESSDVYMLLQGCAQMTFDGSRLLDTACCGYAYLQPAGLAALRQRYQQEVARGTRVRRGWLPSMVGKTRAHAVDPPPRPGSLRAVHCCARPAVRAKMLQVCTEPCRTPLGQKLRAGWRQQRASRRAGTAAAQRSPRLPTASAASALPCLMQRRQSSGSSSSCSSVAAETAVTCHQLAARQAAAAVTAQARAEVQPTLPAHWHACSRPCGA